MGSRASTSEMHTHMVTALKSALTEVGINTNDTLEIRAPGGQATKLTLVAAAEVSTSTALGLTATHDNTTIVVADAIYGPARAILNDAGINWLDLRGHLRLQTAGILIDAPITPRPRPGETARAVVDRPIRGRSGIAVAVDALINAANGQAPSSTRSIAGRADLSQPAIAVAAKRLREAGLLSVDHITIPDLFWGTAQNWRPKWVNLTRLPEGEDRLDLTAGDTRAAIHHGIPLVATDQYPWELYAPDQQTAHLIQIRYGGGEGPTVARIAVIPTPIALGGRSSTGDDPFLFVHPIVAALDAASDASRGAEAVRSWNPEELHRVW